MHKLQNLHDMRNEKYEPLKIHQNTLSFEVTRRQGSQFYLGARNQTFRKKQHPCKVTS